MNHMKSDDLISREEALCMLEFNKHNYYGCGSMKDIDKVMQDIKNLDAVDAEPVIRCKDCEFSRLIHLEDGSVFEGTLHCFTGRGYQQNVFGREYSVISPNNFCASGRRKMDAEVEE